MRRHGSEDPPWCAPVFPTRSRWWGHQRLGTFPKFNMFLNFDSFPKLRVQPQAGIIVFSCGWWVCKPILVFRVGPISISLDFCFGQDKQHTVMKYCQEEAQYVDVCALDLANFRTTKIFFVNIRAYFV